MIKSKVVTFIMSVWDKDTSEEKYGVESTITVSVTDNNRIVRDSAYREIIKIAQGIYNHNIDVGMRDNVEWAIFLLSGDKIFWIYGPGNVAFKTRSLKLYTYSDNQRNGFQFITSEEGHVCKDRCIHECHYTKDLLQLETVGRGKLYIIRGLPGAGKTEESKRMMSSGEIDVFHEADHFFEDADGAYKFNPKEVNDAHLDCQIEVYNSIRAGKNVAVSNTFCQIWEMKPYLNMAKDFGVDIALVECDGDFGSIHNVPESVIAKMKKQWQTIDMANFKI